MTEGQHQRHAYYNDATPLSAFLARSKKAAATTTTQWPPVTLATRMLFGGSSKEGIGGNSPPAPSIYHNPKFRWTSRGEGERESYSDPFENSHNSSSCHFRRILVTKAIRPS